MKKKAIALTVAGSVLFGGTVGAASSYYYDMVQDYAVSKKTDVKESYEEQSQEVNKQIYNDSITVVNQEIERIDKETEQYLQEKLDDKRTRRMNDIRSEIEASSDKAIEDLKAYIDELIAE